MARILFVDDDPLTLETLKRSIELFGHQAVLASSGETAQALVIEQPPRFDHNRYEFAGYRWFNVGKTTQGEPAFC